MNKEIIKLIEDSLEKGKREYEEELQDERRKIKLLYPRFLDTFVTEYQTLMQESVL